MVDSNGAAVYGNIDFLDDAAPGAIGKITELERFILLYDEVFVGLGNNGFRKELLERIDKAGGHVPVLIHPTAYVSPSAVIKAWTVVEPMAVVNANTVVEECI